MGYLTAGLQTRRGDDLSFSRHVFYKYLQFNCETIQSPSHTRLRQSQLRTQHYVIALYHQNLLLMQKKKKKKMNKITSFGLIYRLMYITFMKVKRPS